MTCLRGTIVPNDFRGLAAKLVETAPNRVNGLGPFCKTKFSPKQQILGLLLAPYAPRRSEQKGPRRGYALAPSIRLPDGRLPGHHFRKRLTARSPNARRWGGRTASRKGKAVQLRRGGRETATHCNHATRRLGPFGLDKPLSSPAENVAGSGVFRAGIFSVPDREICKL